MTFVGAHNHEKPVGKWNSIGGTSQNKSSKTRLPVVGNVTMLQFDEPMSSNAKVYSGESQILPSGNKLIGNTDEDEEIMIANMTDISEDFLLDFNHLDGGFLFP